MSCLFVFKTNWCPTPLSESKRNIHPVLRITKKRFLCMTTGTVCVRTPPPPPWVALPRDCWCSGPSSDPWDAPRSSPNEFCIRGRSWTFWRSSQTIQTTNYETVTCYPLLLSACWWVNIHRLPRAVLEVLDNYSFAQSGFTKITRVMNNLLTKCPLCCQ